MKGKVTYFYNNNTSTIADARHQEENLMYAQKMSEGHSARGSQHMYM